MHGHAGFLLRGWVTRAVESVVHGENTDDELRPGSHGTSEVVTASFSAHYQWIPGDSVFHT